MLLVAWCLVTFSVSCTRYNRERGLIGNYPILCTIHLIAAQPPRPPDKRHRRQNQFIIVSSGTQSAAVPAHGSRRQRCDALIGPRSGTDAGSRRYFPGKREVEDGKSRVKGGRMGVGRSACMRGATMIAVCIVKCCDKRNEVNAV